MKTYIRTLTILLFLLPFAGMAAPDTTKTHAVKDEIVILQENYEQNLDSLIQGYLLQKMTKGRRPVKRNAVKDEQWSKDLSKIPDSVFIKRLNKIPTPIPMQYNAHVRNLIEYYLKVTQRRGDIFFTLSNYYNPIFEEILDAKGVPLELKYLPIVESALNPNAVSRAGAVGLWQFMYATGKMYDLNVNSWVDERKDPIKSSVAAANYLYDLHKIFNDWTLAIAAYNCGPGNVNKAIRRAGEGNHDFWAIYEFLPRETRGYVPAFIAATYVMYYHNEHGISATTLDLQIPITDTIMVNENVHFQQISSVISVPIAQLRELNPQYKSDIVPGRAGSSSLRLPIEYVSPFITRYDSIINYNTDSHFKPTDIRSMQPSEIVYHKVVKGDTWSGIAAKYKVTIADIKRWNNTKATYPQLGKRYIIQQNNATYAGNKSSTVSSSSTTTKASTAKTNSSKATKSHTVKQGESLYAIALKYNMKVDDIKSLNNLNSNMIKPGQVLKVYQQ